MVRRLNGRRVGLFAFTLLAALAIALPAAAQGRIKGTVKDDKGQPVAGAKVTIEFQGNVSRKFDMKTDNKGEFIQIGLASGEYKVIAEKDKMAGMTLARVRGGQPAEVNLVITTGGSILDAKQAAAKNAEVMKAVDAGMAASAAGKPDEAIVAFNQAIELNQSCFGCYSALGAAYVQKKDFDKAEAAYKKGIEIKADYAEAYSGLASIYNAQHKFDLAQAASAKASEFSGGGGAAAGGNPDIFYNQGVIAWNAGKVADAKKAFESAIAANPSHAESHYQLGMVLVNEGNLAGAAGEFETYSKLAPDGPNAAQAKALVAQLKK
jgi:tetratricopeptide (TPR) repeat protein